VLAINKAHGRVKKKAFSDAPGARLADLTLVFRTIVKLSYFSAASSNSASQIDRDLVLSCSCSPDMEQCKLCDYCEEPRAPRAACDQCEPTPFPRVVTFLRLRADPSARALAHTLTYTRCEFCEVITHCNRQLETQHKRRQGTFS
jgi:hypothetical protein